MNKAKKITTSEKLFEFLEAMSKNNNKLIGQNSNLKFSDNTNMNQFWNNNRETIIDLIKINKDVINNTTNLLATNWNSGRAPTQEYYKAYISKTMGSYIYCDCLAFNWETKTDLSEMYSGWFNVDDITQIAKL